MDDKEFLEYLVKGIVNHPEDVQVDRKVDELGVLLTLQVNHEDMGQVIGKKGATALAIRTLLRIVGMKSNARVNLKIEEPEGSTRGMDSSSSSMDSYPSNATEETPSAERSVNIDEELGNIE